METIVFDGNELEVKLAEYGKKLDECELLKKLLAEGYTLDSFRYNEERYNHFKRLMHAYKLTSK